MHESVVCQEIVDIVLRAAEANGLTRVDEIVVSAGPYSCLNEAELNFFLLMARVGTCMEDAYITVERDESLVGASQMFVKCIRGE
ncbi:MAG: hydrogenase maturation nickel metallochaperone HypA [Eggerthellaceae bacterium]|nr:hydrogenase maturation nickel metallochaperone HypA [Eggerthellaceae bacterium]